MNSDLNGGSARVERLMEGLTAALQVVLLSCLDHELVLDKALLGQR